MLTLGGIVQRLFHNGVAGQPASADGAAVLAYGFPDGPSGLFMDEIGSRDLRFHAVSLSTLVDSSRIGAYNAFMRVGSRFGRYLGGTEFAEAYVYNLFSSLPAPSGLLTAVEGVLLGQSWPSDARPVWPDYRLAFSVASGEPVPPESLAMSWFEDECSARYVSSEEQDALFEGVLRKVSFMAGNGQLLLDEFVHYCKLYGEAARMAAIADTGSFKFLASRMAKGSVQVPGFPYPEGGNPKAGYLYGRIRAALPRESSYA